MTPPHRKGYRRDHDAQTYDNQYQRHRMLMPDDGQGITGNHRPTEEPPHRPERRERDQKYNAKL